MKKLEYIFQETSHKWAIITKDPERPDYIIDTNEYLISSGEDVIILDPGGMEVFPPVFTAVSSEFNPEKINHIFASHQDPDIISSLSLWMEINPQIKCYISWIWNTFVPHFGGKDDTFIPIPDTGMDIPLGDITLKAIPAHHLHSAGNFHLYDPVSKIYFSGDVGSALVNQEEIFVQDFDSHIKHAELFHKRWMGSNRARVNWCERVSKMNIEILAPQHGALYRGENVERFINWFAETEVGLLDTDLNYVDLENGEAESTPAE